MKLIYPAVFDKDEYGFTVEFPNLPGCVTQGDTLEEAMEMAVDAASGWLLIMIEEGKDIPSPSDNINLMEYGREAFKNLILIDIDAYAKQYGEKSVKKTLSIPRWLNTLSESNGINFSKVLQEGLKRELKLEYDGKVEDNFITFTEVKSLMQELSKAIQVAPQSSMEGNEKDSVTFNSSKSKVAAPTFSYKY